MPNIDDAVKRLDTFSGGLSTQFRTLAIGLLAFSGGMIVSVETGGDKAPHLPFWLLKRLFFIAVLSIVALAFDLAQYGFMYWYMRFFQKALDGEIRIRREQDPQFHDKNSVERDHNEGDCRFVAGRVLFGLKLVLLAVAVCWLAYDAYILLNQARS